MAAGSRLRAHVFAGPLPPPSRESVPTPGPVLLSPPDPTRGAVIVGREVEDAFELIWPTGEIDEQFLGWPLSEEPGAAPSYAPPAVGAVPTPSDTVLAIERAARAVGSVPAAIDQPALLPCLPERSPRATVPAARRSALDRLISRLRRR